MGLKFFYGEAIEKLNVYCLKNIKIPNCKTTHILNCNMTENSLNETTTVTEKGEVGKLGEGFEVDWLRDVVENTRKIHEKDGKLSFIFGGLWKTSLTKLVYL